MSTKGQPPSKRRRVPEAQRRRAAVSCDRCKLRRSKCIRAGADDPCTSCFDSQVKCESTLPRKQRLYGSLEALSLRYRALDALVRGLFPNEDVQDIDTLYRVAGNRGIRMPSVGDHSITHEAFYQQSPKQSTLPLEQAQLHADTSTSSQQNPFGGQPHPKQVEDRLIPTPHGVPHYLGPSSSFGFAAVVRGMVARCSSAPNCKQPRQQQRAVRADFVNLRTSKALENRDQQRDADDTDEEDGVSQVPAVAQLQGPLGNKPTPPDSSGRLSRLSSLAIEMKRDSAADFLSSRETSDALVREYFDRVQPCYPLFHRSMFQLRYEAIWERKNSLLRDLDHGWICCLAMVFALGAQALEQHDKKQSVAIQRRYLGLVRSYIGRLVSHASFLNVQALMLLQLYEHNSGERNAAWMFLGCATRMAVALGMHREGVSSSFDPIERNTRKRVWWTLYMFEQNLCVILGRPSTIDDSEITVGLPDESMLDGSDTPPMYIEHLLRLTQLSHRIKLAIYGPSNLKLHNEELPAVSSAKRLLQDLDSWYNALPPHLLPEWNSMVPKQKRAVLLLHVYYHHTKSLVTRPYHVHKVNMEIDGLERRNSSPPNLPEGVRQLSKSCVRSGEDVIRNVRQLANANLLDGISWLDIYYAYHAVFILCLDLLVRPADFEDTAYETSLKATVKSVFEIVRRQTLASTSRILAQIANQFAIVVGAVDDPINTNGQITGVASANADTDVAPTDKIARWPSAEAPVPAQAFPTQQSVPDQDSQHLQQALGNYWWRPDLSGSVWDFFDMGTFPTTNLAAYGEPQYTIFNHGTYPLPVGGSFGSVPVREGETMATLGEMDDWAARALRGMSRGLP